MNTEKQQQATDAIGMLWIMLQFCNELVKHDYSGTSETSDGMPRTFDDVHLARTIALAKKATLRLCEILEIEKPGSMSVPL